MIATVLLALTVALIGVAIACGAACSWLARRYHLDAGEGFTLGVVLGPLGFLLFGVHCAVQVRRRNSLETLDW